MTKPKFLYGAAVQGIQSFIFQTNALREIAGASELVEQICTDLFKQNVSRFEEENAIVTAAGNIKYVFTDEEQCKALVRKFPKTVMEFAPGITISQAVVAVDGEIKKEHIDELERRLRIQRNTPLRPFDVALMSMNRSRKTGLPAVEEKTIKGENTIFDAGTKAKVETKSRRVLTALLGEVDDSRIPWNMEDIPKTLSVNYSWLAVIHADGNNMGLALQRLAEAVHGKTEKDFIKVFRQFSLNLDKATQEAAREAYNKVYKHEKKAKIPFRPIVIGGDDLTLVCRGDLALEFTKHFLEYFKEKTKENFSELPVKINFLKDGLTACAGIAYIKESYPFHYGYQLAETLCGEAKKAAKDGLTDTETTPSCLMFHKVQDSFVEEFAEIRKRELCAGKGDNKIRFDFGPYYLASTQKNPTIEHLEKCISKLEGKEGNAIKSHLRQWLTDLHNEAELAEQKKLRVISMNKDKLKPLGLEYPDKWTEPRIIMEKGEEKTQNFTPAYDWLTIHSINQEGK